MIRFHCPNCNAKLGVPEGTAGKRGKCPHCGEFVVVPFESTTGDGAAASTSKSTKSPRAARPDQPPGASSKPSRSARPDKPPQRQSSPPTARPEAAQDEADPGDPLAALASAAATDEPAAAPPEPDDPPARATPSRRNKSRRKTSAREPAQGRGERAGRASDAAQDGASEDSPLATGPATHRAPRVRRGARRQRSHHRSKTQTRRILLVVGIAWLATAILPWYYDLGSGSMTFIFSWDLLLPGFNSVGSPGFFMMIPGAIILGMVSILLALLLPDKGRAIAMLIIGGTALLGRFVASNLLDFFPPEGDELRFINSNAVGFAIFQLTGGLFFLVPTLALIHVRAIAAGSMLTRVFLGICAGLGTVALLVPAGLGIIALLAPPDSGLATVQGMSAIARIYVGAALLLIVIIYFAGYVLTLLDVFMPRKHFAKYAALTCYIALFALILHSMILPVAHAYAGSYLLPVLIMGLLMIGGAYLVLAAGLVGLVEAKTAQANAQQDAD